MKLSSRIAGFKSVASATILALFVGATFSACGEATGGAQSSTGAVVSVTSTNNGVFSSNGCVNGKINFSGTSQWYVSGGIDVTNICSVEQNLSGVTLAFTSQDTVGNPVKFTTLNNWWINDTAYAINFTSGSGAGQIGTISASNGNAVLKVGQTISFSGGINLSGSAFDSATAVKTLTLNGSSPAPVTVGSLDVIVDTTNANCAGTTICNGLALNVSDSSGQSVANFTVPTSALGAQYTQPLTNLKDGATYTVSGLAIPNATVTYTPSATPVISSAQKSVVTVKYNQIPPQVITGKATISLPVVVPNYTGTLQAQIINVNANNAIVNSYAIAQGGSFTTEDLPISDATHLYKVQLSAGVADPLAGLYYIENGLPVLVVKQGTSNSLSIPMTATTQTLQNVTLAISGLNSGDNASVTFSDAGNKYFYANYANQANGSTVYKVENGLNFGVSVKASGASYITNPITNAGVVTSAKTISAAFGAQALSSATYDYIAPFKDYNNKIVLSVQGLSSAKSLSFTSNFPQKTGWGTCFGQSVYSLNFSSTQSGTKYITTITPQTSGVSLDLTQTCDIMGTDSGQSLVLTGVSDPIVYSVTADSKTLKIKQPCANTGCKDPGNGYISAGYYAQWSVWGRQYNPYSMPFDSINDVIYAFIGFNPVDGSIKSLDTSADSWGLSAVSRALLQYPYMQAHLSFGGWTNNGSYTTPMFNQLASSSASMNNFATQAIALMRKTGFTGIDIDWEWWSSYDNSSAPAKKMLAFYKVLRTALDQAGQADGKKYTLTIAVNGGVDRIMAMQNASNPNSVSDFWAQVGQIVDRVNIMNYDYHGSWDTTAYFQANYDFANVGSAKVGATEGWSIKVSADAYMAQGVAAKKLVVGIPLYARTMTVSSGTNGGLFQTVTGAGFGDYESGILDYKCVVNPINNPATGCGSANPIAGVQSLSFYNTASNVATFNQYGLNALQPWAYSSQTNSFMTYDDVWSATSKAKAVKAKGLGGTMYWELDGDSPISGLSIIGAVKGEYNK